MRISVTAKNSYGGYVSVNLECGLNNGKFSTESVSNYEQKKELRRIGEKGCHFEALSSSEMEFLGSIQRIGVAARA